MFDSLADVSREVGLVGSVLLMTVVMGYFVWIKMLKPALDTFLSIAIQQERASSNSLGTSRESTQAALAAREAAKESRAAAEITRRSTEQLEKAMDRLAKS